MVRHQCYGWNRIIYPNLSQYKYSGNSYLLRESDRWRLRKRTHCDCRHGKTNACGTNYRAHYVILPKSASYCFGRNTFDRRNP
ncbi:hypothetical protein GCM10027190_21930 [Spirosoma areae]